MALGLIGKKCGMTRIFTEDGVSTPVTLIHVETNRVTQVRTLDIDGYQAVQLATGKRRASRVSKPLAGHFAKADVPAGSCMREFRLADDETIALKAGDEIGVDLFNAGQQVDVTGTSIGKGFAGVVKRHNFHTQDATHGNSLAHRAPGSIGQNQTPGRVFKGKKMSGHMGNERTTTQNLEIVRVDNERNLLMLKGSVPGPKGGDVLVRPAVRGRGKGN